MVIAREEENRRNEEESDEKGEKNQRRLLEKLDQETGGFYSKKPLSFREFLLVDVFKEKPTRSRSHSRKSVVQNVPQNRKT